MGVLNYQGCNKNCRGCVLYMNRIYNIFMYKNAIYRTRELNSSFTPTIRVTRNQLRHYMSRKNKGLNDRITGLH